MEQPTTKNRLPIFISCSQPMVIADIDKHVNSADFLKDMGMGQQSDNFELVVISAQISERLENQYALSKMDVIQQQQRGEQLYNERQRQTAFETAMTLKSILGPDGDQFSRQTLKDKLARLGRRLSHKQIAELMDSLFAHNFIQPIDMSSKPHERMYMLSLSMKDLMAATEINQRLVTDQISKLQNEFNHLEQQRIALEEEMSRTSSTESISEAEIVEEKNKITGDHADLITTDAKPKRKYTKKAKSVVVDSVPVELNEDHGSECSCCNNEEVSETEQYLMDEQSKA